MIEKVDVDEKMHIWASSREKFINGNTIKDNTDNSGRYAGDLAEYCFSRYLFDNLIPHTNCGKSQYEYDHRIGQITIDTKAKNRTYDYASRPERLQIDEAHVKEDQEQFTCDVYVFASVHIEKGSDRAQSVQLIGWALKSRFWEDCKRVERGEETDVGFKESADAGKVKYSKLTDLSCLVDQLKHHLTKLSFDG